MGCTLTWKTETCLLKNIEGKNDVETTKIINKTKY